LSGRYVLWKAAIYTEQHKTEKRGHIPMPLAGNNFQSSANIVMGIELRLKWAGYVD
jgi:hypothetical protein